MFEREGLFRKTVDLARFRFGEGGRYRYFAYPLPEIVGTLRRNLYPPLAEIANEWSRRLRRPERFPASLDEFITVCRRGDQEQATPLLLDYDTGGYNCLHQDQYGDVAFPLQITALLSRPRVDFRGGEFLLVEQRPRMQSRGEAIALEQGQLVIFPNQLRPVRGAKGDYRVNVRHGVSRIRSGRRRTLGIIFHDART